MVRLVKGAYWDSEIKRAQVDGLAGYPGLHPQGPHRRLLPRLRAQAARGAATRSSRSSPPTTPRRWPPIYAAGRARLRAGRLRVPVPARHGRAALRAGRRPATASSDRPCRIYAPVGTHETLLAYLVRRLLENGANTSFVNRIADPAVPIEELIADPVRRSSARRDRRPRRRRRTRRSPCRAALFGAGARNSRGLDLADEAALAALGAALRRAAPRRRWSAAPLLGGDCALARRRRSRCATRPTARDVVGHVPRGHRPSDVAARARRAPPTRRRAGPRRRADERAALLERAADVLRGAMPRAARPARARGRQDLRQRASPKCARRSTSCATTPPQARARLRQRRRIAPLGPGGLHQPVELPAGDLHRPGRRGAGRRQPGARQARRGDAADRRRGRARSCTRPACRAPRCSSCPGAARRRRGAGRRPARRGRDVHRLDRGRAADPAHARRPARRATAGRSR